MSKIISVSISVFAFFSAFFFILFLPMSAKAADTSENFTGNKTNVNVYFINPAVCTEFSPDADIEENTDKEIFIKTNEDGTITYTWQVSSDNGKTWKDIEDNNKNTFMIKSAVYNNGVPYQYKVMTNDTAGYGVSKIIKINVYKKAASGTKSTTVVSDQTAENNTEVSAESISPAIPASVSPVPNNNTNTTGGIENTGDTSGLEWYLILFCLSLLLGIIVTVVKVKKSNRKM
jgi:hypothetical protein